MANWSILWPFGIFYRHFGYFMTIWNIFVHLVHFGKMYKEKSGNPALFPGTVESFGSQSDAVAVVVCEGVKLVTDFRDDLESKKCVSGCCYANLSLPGFRLTLCFNVGNQIAISQNVGKITILKPIYITDPA
jgi:hypothetical protein